MNVDLELAASFLTLVDEWHYGHAATALHVSSSALTKRIQRLERQLGVRLVERGPEGLVGLTAAGMDFASTARALLRQAGAAVEAARVASARGVLRIGVPSGSGAVLASMVTDGVNQSFPFVHVAPVEVPFPLVTRCLLEGKIDVLITIAEVRHCEVESTPLPITSVRIGVVSASHPLAGAIEVPIAKFCEQSLLFNPAIPEEWMRPFWLGDIRPRAEARLTITHGSNNGRVMRDVESGAAAMVTLSDGGDVLPPGLQAMSLVGAEPVTFYAANRRGDRRNVLHTYLRLLQSREPRNLSSPRL